MKAIGLPPSDPRIHRMNDAQWLWCYFNVQEDMIEERDARKSVADYLSWFINPQMAESVHNKEQELQQVSESKSKYKKEDLYKNNEFNREMVAVSKGYDPSSGLTVDEFLAQLENAKQNEEIDIMNDDFDKLLSSGEFAALSDNSTPGVIGNPNETFDDFMDRAFILDGQNINLNNNQLDSNNELEEILDEFGMSDDDLDIFDVD